MKTALISVLSLAACATGTVGIDREPATRTGVQLELVTTPSADRVFPSAIEPALPSVDRLAHQLRARFGEVVAAQLDLCVAPTGEVASATLAASTGFPALDAAIERDAAGWQFTALPGPATVRSCERAQLTYRTPR